MSSMHSLGEEGNAVTENRPTVVTVRNADVSSALSRVADELLLASQKLEGESAPAEVHSGVRNIREIVNMLRDAVRARPANNVISSITAQNIVMLAIAVDDQASAVSDEIGTALHSIASRMRQSVEPTAG